MKFNYDIIKKNPVLSFIDASLRGCGQVWFKNSPITGLILFAGIFYNSITLGLCAVLGTVTSTGAALLLGMNKEAVQDGLYGFNGTLVGIAMGFYFTMDPAHYVYLVMAAVLSSVFMASLSTFMGTWGVAPLTAPFVLSTWIMIFGCYHFSVLHPNSLIGPVALAVNSGTSIASGSWVFLWEGIAKGIGEVMFQDNSVTGCIFLLALIVSSRAAFVWALVGSALGLGTAWIMGAAAQPLQLGIYGYSAVLTGIALGSGVFCPISVKNSLYTALAVIFTAVAQGAIAVSLAPVGMPALTWPFIIVTWVFLFAIPNERNIIAVRLTRVPL